MSFLYEDRISDSPFVEGIWHIITEESGSYMAAADGSWDIMINWQGAQASVQIFGAATYASPVPYNVGVESIGIRFKLGTFLQPFPANHLLNSAVRLANATNHSFWLNDGSWQFPNYENVEGFIERMAREGLLKQDLVITDLLEDNSPHLSLRTMQRRFSNTTGVTQKTIQQIERAHHAANLLQQGKPIIETAFALGYTDQAHMTHSLKRLLGQTPAQLAQVTKP